MSTVFLDSFDFYGSGSGTAATTPALQRMLGRWSAIPDIANIGTPSFGARTGNYAIQNKSFLNYFRYVPPVARSQFYVSFGLATLSLPSTSNSREIISFCNSSNTILIRLFLQADGSIAVADLSKIILATTQGPVITAANWHFLEMTYETGSGVFQLRVDDPQATKPLVLNVNTGILGGTIGGFRFLESTTNSDGPFIDDLFIRDTTGTVNNSWLGDRRIGTLYANGDTPTSGWAASYYKKFGSGILRLAYRVPGVQTNQNNDANLSVASSTGLDIGASDFTLETFIRFDALPSASTYATIFSRWETTSNNRSYRLIYNGTNSKLEFSVSTAGTSATASTPISFPWVPDLNKWYHIAVVRVAGELLLFIDGQQMGVPIASSAAYFAPNSRPLKIGAEYDGTPIVTGSSLVGRLDETRFTNGVGRYTATFTPISAAFPRGTDDPHWSSVVLLMGYDSGIVDESSFNRSVTATNNATAYQVTDGADIGKYSAVNKEVPDDGSFIYAALTPATGTLTMTTQPAVNDTVTVGTKDGTTPAVYKFVNTLTAPFDVSRGSTAQEALTNLLQAINNATGNYGAGTTANFDVVASALPAGQILVTALTAGTSGNSIASTATGSAASWGGATLSGGADIPGPIQFKFSRPPANTTVISAVQTVVRALKTDAGSAAIKVSFVGPNGNTADGTVKNLTTSPAYYTETIEIDPDTSGSISPTTIISGQVKIDRTA